MGPNQTQKFFCTVKETKKKKREREKTTHRMRDDIFSITQLTELVSILHDMPRSTWKDVQQH